MALAVSACVSPVKPIQAWSSATAAEASIGTVIVTNRSTNATPESLAALKSQLEQYTAQCARGPKKYELQVNVDNFKLANPGMTMLLGDMHELAGEVKIVDPENGSVAAEYYVQERTGGAGLVGIAMLAGGAPGISREFASSVCSKVFGRK